MDEVSFPVDSAATHHLGATEDSGAFNSLALRAEAFIAEQGGKAAEDLLIAHVFGTSGSASLWRPLLREVLSRHEAVRMRADGAWLLASAQPERDGVDLLSEFVVLDVETTGLSPARQRVIEVAILRFEQGVPVHRWESLCHPGRSIPAYIVKLTGIDDDLVKDAPTFTDIAATVVEMLAGQLVVGHNVDFDLGFINAELKRLDLSPLVNDRLDTLALSTRLVPSLRKPTLQAVAQKLGHSTKGRGQHRAGADALVTGDVAVTLLQFALDAGYRSIDELKGIARPVTRRPKEKAPRASSVVDRSMLATIPKAPGVYLMRDANEQVVYVGKAKNLRDRVGSYFSQPLGYTRKMDGLIESLQRIQVEVVGSEIEALLLESQLIRRYQPRYNTALRSHEHYPFIRVDVANPWPRVSLAKSRAEDGARYFGPFRSAATARKTVDLINRVVPLRTCTRSFKSARSYGSPCIQLDLGRCMGPCVGRADRDEYMALVRQVVEYVDGRDQSLHELLWQGLEDAAESLDFERASRLRRELQASLSLTSAQRRIRESIESSWALLVTPSPAPDAIEVMMVLSGRVWAQVRADRAVGYEILAERLAESWQRFLQRGLPDVDHDSVDDVHILNSWLAKHEGYPAIIALQQGSASQDWAALASRVLMLSAHDLDVDAWLKAHASGTSGAEDIVLDVLPMTDDVLQTDELIDGVERAVDLNGPAVDRGWVVSVDGDKDRDGAGAR